MKKFLLFALLLGAFAAFGQTPAARIQIKGFLSDSTKSNLPFATVMLLQPKDSTLVSYTRSDDKGAFEFKNQRRQSYLLKVTFVGYLPYQSAFVPNDSPITNLGEIKLKPMSRELFEVVIKAVRDPIAIRGDTIEYNANAFKVGPNATVEDLLRKLPGVSVEQDGSIKAQGQNVQKVTVDGKTFFSNDPKIATKNIPAEAINKIQIFNDKSEQAKFSGIDDGKKEKTINLELKDTFKNGGFGRFTIGQGLDDRREFRGTYSKFSKTEQFSIIGLANNTNQEGFSFNDYRDFAGSQAFSNNNDEFGFSSGNSYYFDSGNSSGVPISSQQGRGFSSSYAGGVNYNFDEKKTKLTSSYFFNQTQRLEQTFVNKKTFLQNNTFFENKDNTNANNLAANHRVNLRYEQGLDSLNTLLVTANGSYQVGDVQNIIRQDFFRVASVLSNQSSRNTKNSSDRFLLNTALTFRHKFRKVGRSFAVNVGYGVNNNQVENTQRTLNTFFGVTSANDFIQAIRQLSVTDNEQNTYKVNASYTEPLSKKVFLENFYNFNASINAVNREVTDTLNDVTKRNDNLSRYFKNTSSYNRVGLSVRYAYKGLNYAIGAAVQRFDISGKVFASKSTPNPSLDVSQRFITLLPNARFSYDLKQNTYLSTDYTTNVREPQVTDLQAITDNSNPLFITEGNPNLIPEVRHNVSLNFSRFNQSNFTNIYTGLGYGYTYNQIVYNQSVDDKLVTRTKPANIDGAKSFNAYLGYGLPLKTNKIKMNGNFNYSLSLNPTFINDVRNETNSVNYSAWLGLDLSPSDFFTMYLNARTSISKTEYSINSTQNQTIYSSTVSSEMNIKLPKNYYINTNFSYRSFVNNRFNFNQKVAVLNLAFYKLLLPNNRGELRLTAYDVFNQNLGVSQNASQNFVSETRTLTLGRYYMLGFTYNIKGVKSQMKRGNF